MPKPIVLPDVENLGAGVELTDDQRQVIADEKEESWDTETPPATKVEKTEEEIAAEEEAARIKKEEVKTPEEEAEEAKAKEEAEAREKAETVENKRLDKKAKELNKTVEEVKGLETSEKTEQERIEKVAKDEGLTVEEVKENETKDLSIADRHGKDPIKIARALRKEQSEYGKLKNEVEGLREYKTQSETNKAKFNDQTFNAQMEERQDEVIELYREKYPNDSDDVSDDVVFERAKGLIRKGLEDKEKEAGMVVKKDAELRRTDLLKNIPEEFKEFIPDVKKMLTECDDRQILDKEFDASYLANYVRGRKYTPDYVKSLETAAYKRGSEQSKIIPKIPKSTPTSKKSSSVLIASMSNTDRARAEEIYSRHEDWTKERMWEEYAKDGGSKDDF